MKQFISVCTAVAIFMSCAAGVFAAESKWYDESMHQAVANGYMSGDENGNLNPEMNITRAEYATMLVNITGARRYDPNIFFSDVEKGTWYERNINYAVAAGYFEGDGNGGFRPDDNISRQEAAVVTEKAFPCIGASEVTFTDAQGIAEWAKASVEKICGNGYINGYPDGSFKAQNPISRAEAATILVGIADNYIRYPSRLSNESYTGNLVLKGASVLENVDVSGDIYCLAGVDNTEIRLNNVKANRIFYCGINGGSLGLENVTAETVVTSGVGKVGVLYTGDTAIEKLIAEAETELVVMNHTGKVNVDAAADMSINGKVEALAVLNKAKIQMINGSDISELAIGESAANSVVIGEGTIDTVTTLASATVGDKALAAGATDRDVALTFASGSAGNVGNKGNTDRFHKESYSGSIGQTGMPGGGSAPVPTPTPPQNPSLGAFYAAKDYSENIQDGTELVRGEITFDEIEISDEEAGTYLITYTYMATSNSAESKMHIDDALSPIKVFTAPANSGADYSDNNLKIGKAVVTLTAGTHSITVAKGDTGAILSSGISIKKANVVEFNNPNSAGVYPVRISYTSNANAECTRIGLRDSGNTAHYINYPIVGADETQGSYVLDIELDSGDNIIEKFETDNIKITGLEFFSGETRRYEGEEIAAEADFSIMSVSGYPSEGYAPKVTSSTHTGTLEFNDSGTQRSTTRYMKVVLNMTKASVYSLKFDVYAQYGRDVYILNSSKNVIKKQNVSGHKTINITTMLDEGENIIYLTAFEGNTAKHELYLDYIDIEEQSGAGYTLANPGAAGKYAIKITYSGATEGITILNGSKSYTISHPTSGDGQTDYIVAELDTGNNTFIIDESVDSLEIVEPGDPITYRAREIVIAGGSWNQGGMQPGPGNTTETFILNGNPVSSARHVKLNLEVPESGNYTVRLRGASGTQHGGIADAERTILFNAGLAGWQWSGVTNFANSGTVYLEEGMNTLYFVAINGSSLGNGAVLTSITLTKNAD